MINVKPCPCCETDQIQVCIDSNNPQMNRAKCRRCGITGLVSSWNIRPDKIYSKYEMAEKLADLYDQMNMHSNY